jgi:fructose-specific phosphotransferase system IIC component
LSLFNQYVFLEFSTEMNRRLNYLWGAVAITYGLMIAGIGAQYPKGPIVALVLCPLIGGILVATLYLQKRIKWGASFVLQAYILSYILAFIIVLVYGTLNNFKGRNEH